MRRDVVFSCCPYLRSFRPRRPGAETVDISPKSAQKRSAARTPPPVPRAIGREDHPCRRHDLACGFQSLGPRSATFAPQLPALARAAAGGSTEHHPLSNWRKTKRGCGKGKCSVAVQAQEPKFERGSKTGDAHHERRHVAPKVAVAGAWSRIGPRVAGGADRLRGSRGPRSTGGARRNRSGPRRHRNPRDARPPEPPFHPPPTA